MTISGESELKKSLFISLIGLLIGFLPGLSHATCSGKFTNPIEDICWTCMFPIKLLNTTIYDAQQLDTYPAGSVSPAETCGFQTCRCGSRCGVPMSFYEPARQFDVTKTPGCLPGLGMQVDMSGLPGGQAQGMSKSKQSKGEYTSFHHVNVYVNPILFWLDVLADHPCLERQGFDLLYFTPADLCWVDESSCKFLEPDSFLFGNLAGTLACTADAVLQNSLHYFSRAPEIGQSAYINSTYWCAGSNGHTFPLTGFNNASRGRDLQDSMLLGQRIFTKLHREMLVWGTSGAAGLCGYYPKPFMDKLDYKASMTFPRPQTEKSFGRCCQTFGVNTAIWGSGRSWPVTGEDYSFMTFRRRDCCIGNVDIAEVTASVIP